MQCPRCGDEINPDAQCRRCQQAELLRSLAGEAVPEKECPRCGKATRANAAVCDKCGYVYDAKDSPAERYQAQLAEEARAVPSALSQTVSPYLSWAVIGVCLLLMAGGAWLMLTASLPGGDAAGADEAILRRSHRPRPAGTLPVTYQVSGTAARAMVAYRDADGKAAAPPEAVSLPWTQTLDARSGADLSVSARPVGGGTVTCMISADGKIRKQADTPGSDGLTTVSDTLSAK